MSKVGILTFHNAENFGGALQAYGMQKTIEKIGHDCKIIDYRNKGVLKRNILKSVYYFCTFQKAFQRIDGFKEFQKLHMNLTSNIYKNKKELEKEIDQFDYIFFGSDQIWNPDLSNGFDDIYFGNFRFDGKKISYAASIGKDTIPKEQLLKINDYVQNFDNISVREENIIPMINRKVELVLDPSLLLNREEWIELSSNELNHSGYILVYQLYNNKKLTEITKDISKRTNKEVYKISPYIDLNDLAPKKINHIGPKEFLEYFMKCDYVITDSFHGTAFSIIFNKKFYVILPPNKGGRIKTLLSKLNLMDRIVKTEIFTTEEINYEAVMNKLKIEKMKSIEFIKRSLNE